MARLYPLSIWAAHQHPHTHAPLMVYLETSAAREETITAARAEGYEPRREAQTASFKTAAAAMRHIRACR